MVINTNKLGVPQSRPYKDQVDNLPTDSQPDPTETFDIGLPTANVHKTITMETSRINV